MLTVLPHGDGISWQSHLGGALAGVLSGFLFRRVDPTAPRQRYSWEREEEERTSAGDDAHELEPAPPREVPVLWQRTPEGQVRGVVVRLRPPGEQAPPE